MRQKVDAILDIVTKFYSHPISVISSPENSGDYSKIKQICQYMLFNFLNKDGNYYNTIFQVKEKSLSLMDIGSLFGGGEGIGHPTVLYSLRTVRNRIDTDNCYRNEVMEVATLIYKHCDFGTREIITTSRMDNIFVDLMRDKKGNQYYRIKSDDIVSIFTDNEMKNIVALVTTIDKAPIREAAKVEPKKDSPHDKLTEDAYAAFKRQFGG